MQLLGKFYFCFKKLLIEEEKCDYPYEEKFEEG